MRKLEIGQTDKLEVQNTVNTGPRPEATRLSWPVDWATRFTVFYGLGLGPDLCSVFRDFLLRFCADSLSCRLYRARYVFVVPYCIVQSLLLRECSQRTNWTELTWTDLNKSTRWLFTRVSVTTTCYWLAEAKLGPLVLDGFWKHVFQCVCWRDEVQFTLCAVNKPLIIRPALSV